MFLDDAWDWTRGAVGDVYDWTRDALGSLDDVFDEAEDLWGDIEDLFGGGKADKSEGEVFTGQWWLKGNTDPNANAIQKVPGWAWVLVVVGGVWFIKRAAS